MSSRRWVHGTTTYDRNNPRVFIALGGDGMFHLFVNGVLTASTGSLADAKRVAA